MCEQYDFCSQNDIIDALQRNLNKNELLFSYLHHSLGEIKKRNFGVEVFANNFRSCRKFSDMSTLLDWLLGDLI